MRAGFPTAAPGPQAVGYTGAQQHRSVGLLHRCVCGRSVGCVESCAAGEEGRQKSSIQQEQQRGKHDSYQREL
jgi:hypothetical protein